MPYFVYILASQPQSTIYIGVTNDLVRRVYEHRTNAVPGFTARHNIHQLVYFEATENVEAAIQREKRLKKWPRDWKRNLIEQDNPTWTDLYPDICK